MHGKGSWRAERGGTLVGWFERGAPHGEATFKDTGVVYKGQWRDGAPEGRGRWESNESGMEGWYEGQWECGRRHGHGDASEEGCGEYRGEWRQGGREGQGVYTSSGGEVSYEGEWNRDSPHGHGRYKEWRHGEFAWYEGAFQQGVPHGAGMCGEGRRGTQFEGEWLDGIPQGLAANPTFRAITPHRVIGTLELQTQDQSKGTVLFM